MNRQLEIDIDSNDEDEFQREQSNFQEEELDESQENSSREEIGNNLSSRKHNQMGENKFQSVQTFGNQRDYANKDPLNSQIPKRNIWSQLNNYDGPIGGIFEDSSRKLKSSHNFYNNSEKMDERQIEDDKVTEIINKVMKKYSSIRDKKIDNQQKYEIEKLQRIDRINKNLLSENTNLLRQINLLSKKISNINKNVHSSKDKLKREGFAGKQDSKDLIKTLSKYKQKLIRASQINSKLSNSLITEKSKSQIISHNYRSMRKKGDATSFQMVSSVQQALNQQKPSISNNNYREGKSRPKKAFCEKCARDLSRSNYIKQDKEKLYSPILQFKSYSINGNLHTVGDIKQFQLSKRDKKNVECQVSFDYMAYCEQLNVQQVEEETLQKIIKENNEKICYYENQLYKMIDSN